MTKTCIIVAGPTAVGKTAFAIRLAQFYNTRIISADSRQCFKELNIGVAKPTAAELQLVTHHFINSHSVHEDVNAAVFEQYALLKSNEIFAQHDVVVMVGGTGLYINAFCNGIDAVPAVDMAVRQKIIDEYEANGLAWLQQQVQQQDALYFARGEIKNPQRLMRALEVKLSTGVSITQFQTQQKKQRPFNIIKLGLELPKEQLHRQIHTRVDAMIAAGLVAEAESLLPLKKLNALQTVGYRELFDYFNGDMSLDVAVERIKINTRQYAKRQLTWFKKDPELRWVSPQVLPSALMEDISSGR